MAEEEIDEVKVEESEVDNETLVDESETKLHQQSPADAVTENEGSKGAAGNELEQLRQELAAANDNVLRYQAETQNALRRAERDVEKAHKFGQEKLIGELLAVVDNLERSITATEAEEVSLESIREGVKLTLKSLLDTLKHHNVEQIDPEGEPFDPALHQAMTMVPSADQEPNSVLNVFQKGYSLHGRLVRPAMVVVSKAPDDA